MEASSMSVCSESNRNEEVVLYLRFQILMIRKGVFFRTYSTLNDTYGLLHFILIFYIIIFDDSQDWI